jgi:hypothetical protein
MKASIYSEIRFFTNGEKNLNLWSKEIRNSPDGNPTANIYESLPGQAKDHITPST